jgi:hypothetical protein
MVLFAWSEEAGRTAFLLFAVAVAYQIFVARRADFVIRVRDGRVSFRGKFPAALQGAASEFLLTDLGVTDRVRILGNWPAGRGGRLVLWFRGRLSDGQKQRVRNFLNSQA